MAFEKYLVDYCSPTLASVKTANLFNWFYESVLSYGSRFPTGIF